MRRLILGLVFLLAGAVNAFGQSTTVSGNVTDSGSQAWAGGTFQFQFAPNPQFPTGPYTWTGGTLNKVISGTLDGSGNYSVSIPSNTAISPQGSKWILQVTPNATSPSFSTPPTTITGGTQTLNATPPAVTTPPTLFARAYADSEITGATLGSQYFNVTTSLVRVCTVVTGLVCTTWANVGAGGGGGLTGSGTANTIAVWTGATSLGNSEITDDGAGTVTVSANINLADVNQIIFGQQGTIVNTYVAGATLTNGELVKFSGTAELVIPATTSDTGDVIVGVTQAIATSVPSGTPVEVVRIGSASIVIDNAGSCTAQEPIINSTTTGGAGHCTASPGTAQVVGAFFNDPGNANADIYPLVNVASGGLSGLTTNVIPKATSPTTIGNGDLTDNGTTVASTVPVTFSGCALGGQSDRSVAGTTDTILAADRCNRVVYTSATAVAVTLPQAGTTGFDKSFFYTTSDGGAGPVTITPTVSTINGNTTLVLNEGDACRIGPNSTGASYAADCAPPQLVAGTGITLTPAVHSLTIASTGSGISGLTTGVIPQAGSSTTIVNSSPQLDNGVSTANALTYAGSVGIAANGFQNKTATAAEQYDQFGRIGIAIPVPYFKPTAATSVIALDLFPTGSPSNFTANTGVAWFDTCDANPDVATNFNCIRLRTDSSGKAYLSSVLFGSATIQPLELQENGGAVGIGAQPVAGALLSGSGFVFSGNGAASTPSALFNGSVFTGGNATTTVANVYINQGATAPSSWNTNGTEFGINAPSGFTGNFLDFHVNGPSFYSVSNSGAMTTSGAAAFGGNVSVPAASIFNWTGRSRLASGADGRINLANNANTGFTRLTFGLETTSFPAFTISGTNLGVTLGDGSAGGTLTAGNLAAMSTCGATSTCANTALLSNAKIIIGSAPLVSGTPSAVTISGISPAFTSSTSYKCTVSDQTAVATALFSVTYVSGSSFTITGGTALTDTVGYICAGN